MISMNTDLCAVLLAGLIIFIGWKLFNKIIFPKIIRHGMKEIERNPKWVTSQLKYYGFHDVDFVLCESKWDALPYFREGKNNRLELWIDNDTLTKDVEEVGQLALVGKIKVKYGLWFPDKPIHWLSILCYMLDGGDVNIEDKRKQETS